MTRCSSLQMQHEQRNHRPKQGPHGQRSSSKVRNMTVCGLLDNFDVKILSCWHQESLQIAICVSCDAFQAVELLQTGCPNTSAVFAMQASLQGDHYVMLQVCSVSTNVVLRCAALCCVVSLQVDTL